MDAGEFYDEDFFRTLSASNARALLSGRRALLALGAPVMTTDYDLWLHRDDIEALNRAFEGVDHFPSCAPDEARARGRYVLENGQHIDVMVARAKGDGAGKELTFEDAWNSRQTIVVGDGFHVNLPAIEHLIVTRRWASRPRDLVDIEWLTLLAKNGKT